MSNKTFTAIQNEIQGAIRHNLESEAMARGIDPEAVLGAFDAPDHRSLRDLFGSEPPLALVGFDTPGIQRYVFKVKRPGERQGGSNFIADFTREHEEAGGEGRKERTRSLRSLLESLKIRTEGIVFAGGGSGLVVVAAGQAARVVAAIEGALAERTGGDLKTAAARLSVWPIDLAGHSPAPGTSKTELSGSLAPPRSASRYARALAALYARLDHRRCEITPLGEGMTGEDVGNGKPCESCGERPGAIERKTRGDTVCKLCHMRGEEAGKEKNELEQAKTTLDLFPEGQSERRRLALVYADGSNFGAAFQEMTSPAEHRALSLAVDNAFRNAVKEALDRCANPPHQLPIQGGDDLVLLVSAEHVFDLTRVFVEKLERLLSIEHNPLLRDAFADTKRRLRGTLGAFGVGVGIAIADETFPDRLLLGYATELLKSAKNRIREERDQAATDKEHERSKPARSAIDFLVLRSGSPLNGSVQELREQHFERTPPSTAKNEPRLRLTRRPYTAPAFASFLAHTKLLAKTVPPTQIHALHRAVRQGFQESKSFFRYQHGRDTSKEDPHGWSAFRRACGVSLEDIDGLLWSEGQGGRYDTDYLDMVEIFDLFERTQEAHE